MSVIAKLNVTNARDFGSGALVEMSCVCADNLMAEYAGSHEDKLFTKYSPWGEARLHLSEGVVVPFKDDQFYLLVLTPDEIEAGMNHDQAAFSCPIYIPGITDRGEGAAKQVEFVGGRSPDGRISNFNWRMSVDNPGATDQFVAGKSGFLLGFYPVSRFNRDEAINAVHDHA